jgi:hypothetical protein
MAYGTRIWPTEIDPDVPLGDWRPQPYGGSFGEAAPWRFEPSYWAEAGLTAGEVTNALGEHGLAIPFGDTANVGIAGLTLGGGIGYLARKHGLAIDHLIGAELVTADGTVR